MWKDYSVSYIKNNRAAGVSVMVAAFISALLLSLLCSLFYNFWAYEVERIKREEGDWQGRITGSIDENTIDTIRNYANVKSANINQALSEGAEKTLDLSFHNMRTIVEDMPRIAKLAGLPSEAAVCHYALLNMYLIRDPGDPAPRLIFPFMLGIMVLACFSLIMIIHNSFGVSMNARIHQFGILSSIGATPAQIRACLLQEAAALCIPPIVAGNGLGILISAGVIGGMNHMLADVETRLSMDWVYHPWILAVSVGITIITVWISAWIPAGKMSRLTPLNAIKNTGELQLRRRKHSPLLTFLFGMEGELAGNAMKAQKKTLRTATISLTVSFLAFTMMTCFFTLTAISQRMTYFARYQDVWDIMVTVKDKELEAFPETAALQGLSGTSSVYAYQKAAVKRIVGEEEFSEEFRAMGGMGNASAAYVTPAEGGWLVNAPVLILDDASFLDYVTSLYEDGLLDRSGFSDGGGFSDGDGFLDGDGLSDGDGFSDGGGLSDGDGFLDGDGLSDGDGFSEDKSFSRGMDFGKSNELLSGAVVINRIRDVNNPNFRDVQYSPYLNGAGDRTVLCRAGEEAVQAEIPVLGYTMQLPLLKEAYGELDYYELVHVVPLSVWKEAGESLGGREDDLYIRILAGEGKFSDEKEERTAEAKGAFSAEEGKVPEAKGTFSEEAGKVPEAKGAFSAEEGKVPEAKGTFSEEAGKVPEAMGVVSVETGKGPDSEMIHSAGENSRASDLRENVTLAELNKIAEEAEQILGDKYNVVIENRIQDKENNDDMIRGMMLILGGFCVLLAIIGIGNVFSNTLGFVRQRRREFARYLSVGLTPEGIRKMFYVEALVIAGRPVLITLPLTVAAVGLMIKASYLDPMVFIREAPLLPIFGFFLAILGFVALAYYLGGRKVLQCSLMESLRDDTMI